MSERRMWKVVVPDENGRLYVYETDAHLVMSKRTVAHQVWLKHCREGGDADPGRVKATRVDVEAA